MSEQLVNNGVVISYVLAGVVAFIGLGLIQLIRRRRDVKQARLAVRLASHSINPPRLGPIAIGGTYRDANNERWIECNGQRVALDSGLTVVRGTRATWRNGVRTYVIRDGDGIIAIGVMTRPAAAAGTAAGWRLGPSAGESAIQIFAFKPTPAPPPLLPWRAPLFLALCGAIGYFGLYGAGVVLLDVPREEACAERSVTRYEIAAALPQVRAEALSKLERCHKAPP